MAQKTQALILAGGQGSRLHPLTKHRAKPAVTTRVDRQIIDDVLENCILSTNIGDIVAITQYKPRSLNRNLYTQQTLLDTLRKLTSTKRHLDEFAQAYRSKIHVTSPAEDNAYTGTADAVFHAIEDITSNGVRSDSPVVMVFGGDHSYRLDAAQVEAQHLATDADLTIMAIPVRVQDAAKKFGVLVVDKNNRVVEFEEKPTRPTEMPNKPGYCLASMGNYAFKRSSLVEALGKDQRKTLSDDRAQIAADPEKYTSNDFGFDVINMMRREGAAIFAYDFATNVIPGVSTREQGYWRDIGTLEDYYATNMELVDDDPVFDVRNTAWTAQLPKRQYPPSRMVSTSVVNGLVGQGVSIEHALIYHSLISPNVTIGQGADIHDSIVFSDTVIGRNVKIKRAILDKDVIVPDGERIGYDHERDEHRGLHVTKSGIVVVEKGYRFK